MWVTFLIYMTYVLEHIHKVLDGSLQDDFGENSRPMVLGTHCFHPCKIGNVTHIK